MDKLKVFNKFEHIYLINRKIDKSRLEGIKAELSSIGVESYERVEAVNGWEDTSYYKKTEENSKYEGWTKGAAGLVETTINILEDAIKKEYKSIVILEDDLIFNLSIIRYEKFIEMYLPNDWELFHYASHDYIKPLKMGKLKQLKGAWSCQCYAINHTIYKEYLSLLKTSYVPIDLVTSREFHSRGNSYACKHSQITTVPNLSSIRGKEVNYNL